MRLEAMASIGHYAPSNLTHVILDNNAHESTGGQPTLSSSVDFTGLARACGYGAAVEATSAEGLHRAMRAACDGPGPRLVHVRIRCGSDPKLGRPDIEPPRLADRFRTYLQDRARRGNPPAGPCQTE